MLGLYALDSRLAQRTRAARAARAAGREAARRAVVARSRAEGRAERRARLPAAARITRSGSCSTTATRAPSRSSSARGRSTRRSWSSTTSIASTSINHEVLEQLRTAKTRISRTSRALAARADTARSRDSRAGRDDPGARRGASRADRLHRRPQASARAELPADHEARRLRRTRPECARSNSWRAERRRAVLAARRHRGPCHGARARPNAHSLGGRVRARPGTTASGLPVGWGVVAVDPERDPARYAHDCPRLRRGRRRRHGWLGQRRDHRPLVPDRGPGAGLGTAVGHDHPRLASAGSRPSPSRDTTRRDAAAATWLPNSDPGIAGASGTIPA